MSIASNSESSAITTRRIEVIPFDGKDFGLWKMRMEGLFMAHDLLDVVETDVAEKEMKGEESSPGSSFPASRGNRVDTALQERKEEIVRKSQRAYGILLQSLQNEQLRLVQTVKRGNAYGVWRTLLENYERKSMANKIQLLERLFNIRFQHGETIATYVARLTEIERKLKEQGEEISESILTYLLLRGLPESYTSIVQLIKLKEVLTLKEAVDLLRNEEERQEVKNGHTVSGDASESAVVTAAAAAAITSQKRCFTCGQSSHIKYDCPRNRDKPKCTKCRRVGHTARECRDESISAHSAYILSEESDTVFAH